MEESVEVVGRLLKYDRRLGTICMIGRRVTIHMRALPSSKLLCGSWEEVGCFFGDSLVGCFNARTFESFFKLFQCHILSSGFNPLNLHPFYRRTSHIIILGKVS
jgi:hypothetical protein